MALAYCYPAGIQQIQPTSIQTDGTAATTTTTTPNNARTSLFRLEQRERMRMQARTRNRSHLHLWCTDKSIPLRYEQNLKRLVQHAASADNFNDFEKSLNSGCTSIQAKLARKALKYRNITIPTSAQRQQDVKKPSLCMEIRSPDHPRGCAIDSTTSETDFCERFGLHWRIQPESRW